LKYSIAILAGGTSKRMGTDKAMLPFGGGTMLEHIKSICEQQTDDLMICSNNADHKIEDTPLVSDIAEDIGPLGGLIPAMEQSKNEWLFVVSCDMPFVDDTFFSEMEKHLSRTSTKSIVPISNERPQYLCAVYHKSILESWKSQITANNFSVKYNLSKANCSFVEMDFLMNNTFRNINTIDEYQSILK
jgi:molybdopterin-guanine dinucleotide biosynthesis protein A